MHAMHCPWRIMTAVLTSNMPLSLRLFVLACVLQTYIINQAKVMFLNQRPQSKMSRPGAADACLICSRTLREGCSYCSLACKVEALVASGKLAGPTSGSASDSSDCWPSNSDGGLNDTHHHGHAHHDSGSGDSSSSHELVASLAGAGQPATGATGWQQQKPVGAAAAALVRRHSDSDSEGRSTGYCCRRKQSSPRRSPLL
jgi:hypothetical protein